MAVFFILSFLDDVSRTNRLFKRIDSRLLSLYLFLELGVDLRLLSHSSDQVRSRCLNSFGAGEEHDDKVIDDVFCVLILLVLNQ